MYIRVIILEDLNILSVMGTSKLKDNVLQLSLKIHMNSETI